MKTSGVVVAGALGIAAVLAACAGQLTQHGTESSVRIGANDIGGVVTSTQGPEAGVWVIAETKDLPTKFAKMVVTDDRGRYVMPELPRANYRVWVRGYGLIDSPEADAAPGRILDLKATIAPSAAAAAQYYPPIYWYSMLGIPAKNEFPAGEMKSQPEWLNQIKTTGCMSCHALGTQATRTMPK
ncbi:MAG TPA: carboxypeptidase-like regulatory domain-containing protein, partial [Burkholderiales bacterium]|nr:carboxypeptidase-like regulatory domain-containing protein [Burkholderiales bacterium]